MNVVTRDRDAVSAPISRDDGAQKEYVQSSDSNCHHPSASSTRFDTHDTDYLRNDILGALVSLSAVVSFDDSEVCVHQARPGNLCVCPHQLVQVKS